MTENTPLLTGPQKKSIFTKENLTKVKTGLYNSVYHFTDLLRITLVSQTLIATMLNQAFEHHHNTTGLQKAQKTWLGFPVMGLALAVAASIKGKQYLDSRNNKEYFAYQDYVFAAFSGAIVYTLLGMMLHSSDEDNTTPGVFWAATVIMTMLSVGLVKMTFPDSSNRISISPPDDNQTAKPTGEKLMSMFLAATYATFLPTLFWAKNREEQGKTVNATNGQIAGIAIVYAYYAVISYHLSKIPKLFHVNVQVAKAFRDGSLSYAGLSGIAFHILMAHHHCHDQIPCWNSKAEQDLSYLFITLSAVIGLYSAFTTEFKFAQYHEKNTETCQMIAAKATIFCDKFRGLCRIEPDSLVVELQSLGHI
jgi:hypothetical protein